MINEMIYMLIYVVCMVAVLAVFVSNKSRLKIWQKVIAVIFAPVMVVVLIVGTIVLCIDHIETRLSQYITPKER